MIEPWQWTDADRATAEGVQGRLPDRVFDAHAHLYRRADFHSRSTFVGDGPEEAGLDTWRQRVGRQVGPGRLCGALCVAMPGTDERLPAINEYVAAQVSRQEAFRAAVMVSPNSSRQELESLLELHPNIRAFKCYHTLVARKGTFQARIEEYLPEWAWEIAQARGMAILLHMVRDRALADPENQRSIRRQCERYPDAKLILAHAARGFHAPNTVAGIGALAGLQNVWFDTSAVCEAAPILAILDVFGPRRVMWGSDFPVSEQRGRCVTLGTGFVWVTTDQVAWNEKAFFGEPVLVGLESIRALLAACDEMRLAEEDLADVFCENARRLLGLVPAHEDKVQERYRQAKEKIPGGTQLLSKRPEMFAPGQWPAYFREARGCEIWDTDGRHYYDFSTHGIGACLLGFRDPAVTRAVQRRIALGSYCTLNPPEEVELAEKLCELHPWAEQVRFGRSGGEMMSVAVRIGRAATDRSVVAVCGYHGWHDWYLAANLGEEDSLRGHLLPGLDPLGVPRELRGTTVTFAFNDRQAFKDILDKHGPRLAAVVMEPCRHRDPDPGFLEFVRDGAHQAGAVLIFDEITIGWRLIFGGAHLRFGVNPDMAVFAKALGNGHPMAAVIGTRAVMDAAQRSFISSTYWTEGVGPTAALATLRRMKETDVPAHCRRIGNKIQDVWRGLAQRHGVPISAEECYPVLPRFTIRHEQAQAVKTLFVQAMLRRGFLATTVVHVTLSHTERIVDLYEAAVDEAFAEIAKALAAGDVTQQLKGPLAHEGFRRLV